MLGAFLVGMILGESDFRFQIQDDLRSFRETLLGLFFVTVGMIIDSAVILAHWPVLLVACSFLVLGKVALLVLLGLLLGWTRAMALRTAVILAHSGEFGLLLVTQATHARMIELQTAQPLLGAMVLNMALAPLLIARNESLVHGVFSARRTGTEAEQEAWLTRESEALEGHVLLLRCGRVGRQVAAVLEAAGVPYIAFENDPASFQVAKRQGYRVVLADAGRLRLLDAAGLSRARLLVATFSYGRPIERILHHARQVNPAIQTLVSAADEADLA